MEHYYHRSDLLKFPEIGKESPELWNKFLDWYSSVFAEGALTEREKALIALAVAHTVQCPYCIDAYSQPCLEKGSNRKQLTEGVRVPAAIGGRAAGRHGVLLLTVVCMQAMS